MSLSAGIMLSNADVGKVIELFGVGPATTGQTSGLDCAHPQCDERHEPDHLGSGGLGSNAVTCTIGTQNAPAFQHVSMHAPRRTRIY